MKAVDRPGFARRINALFGKRTMFVQTLVREPRLVCLGDYEPEESLVPRISDLREYLSQDGRYNEMQGIFSGQLTTAENGTVTIPYRRLDYATARAIREAGDAPPVLSVGTIGVCLDRRSLFVHRRESGAPSNAGLLHSFSGGYRVDEGEGVIAEGLREFAEETGLGRIAIDPALPPPRLALFRDNDYGAFETCLLGVTLTPAQVARIAPTVEGRAQEICFDALPGSLLDGNDGWTEGGRLEVLTWLAMDAPPCPPGSRFGHLTQKELFLEATV